MSISRTIPSVEDDEVHVTVVVEVRGGQRPGARVRQRRGLVLQRAVTGEAADRDAGRVVPGCGHGGGLSGRREPGVQGPGRVLDRRHRSRRERAVAGADCHEYRRRVVADHEVREAVAGDVGDGDSYDVVRHGEHPGLAPGPVGEVATHGHVAVDGHEVELSVKIDVTERDRLQGRLAAVPQLGEHV